MNETGLLQVSKEKDGSFVRGDRMAYKKVKSNGDYIATISLGIADCFIPVLTTYTKDGKIIDEKSISVGYCGSDCGYICEEFMKINKDYTIYTSDTISSSECDSLGNIIPGTTENYLIYRKGQLRTDGIIELTDEIKKAIK